MTVSNSSAASVAATSGIASPWGDRGTREDDGRKLDHQTLKALRLRAVDVAGRRSFAAGVWRPASATPRPAWSPCRSSRSSSPPRPVLASIALGAIWATVSGTWLCLYVWTIDKARVRASKPRGQRLVHAATGATMLGLGIPVAVGS
jgi:hypothetical protein